MRTAAILLPVALLLSQLSHAADPKEIQVRSSAYFPRPTEVITVDAKLVEVGVVVRDSKGHPIGGLQRGDFEITDNGKKRPITAFSVETYAPTSSGTPAAPANARPRFVAVLFDDITMGAEEITHSKIAALRLVKQGMASNDQVGVFTTSQERSLPFTRDTAKIIDAIERIASRARSVPGAGCPTYTPYDAYLITVGNDAQTRVTKFVEALRCQGRIPAINPSHGIRGEDTSVMLDVNMTADAVWQHVRQRSKTALGSVEDLVNYLTRFDGKRVILLASQGFLTATLETEQSNLVNRALYGKVVIDAIDARGLYAEGAPTAGGTAGVRSLIHPQNPGIKAQGSEGDVMAVLANSTGGLFFHNNNDLDQGLRELGIVPDVSYLLGFAPDPPDGKFHRLTVHASKYSEVEARSGYMSVAPSPPEAKTATPLDRLVMSADALNDVPCNMVAAPSKTAAGQTAVQAITHLDVKQLQFQEAAGVRTQKLIFVAALFDGAGNFVTGKQGQIVFSLSDATYAGLIKDGINASLILEAPPGAYRLRGVVQESLAGKLMAVTQPVTIP